MAEWRTVAGTVVGADGRPVPGARVALGDIPGLPETALVVDDDGRFTAHLPAFGLCLTAFDAQGRSASAWIDGDDDDVRIIFPERRP